MVNKKHAFWQALFSAILIFGIGLLLGLWIENNRIDQIEELLLRSEINLLDSQLIGLSTQNFDIKCDIARENLFQFADDIYEEAKLLEQYDESSQLSTALNTVHKRYDLLRLILWSESIRLKDQCEEDFNTVVYIYQYTEPSVLLKSEQVAFARFLEDLKEEQGSDLLLIPIAGDLDLNSIEIIKESYDLNRYPSIIVNEEQIVDSLEKLVEIDNILQNNN